MKSVILSLLLTFSTTSVANEIDTFAPLQPAHEGLWADPAVEGKLVQVYPIGEGALVVVNEVLEENKNFAAMLYRDFNGVSRTEQEDNLLNSGSPITWTISGVGNTCESLKIHSSDGVFLNLIRIAPQLSTVSCYVCPTVDVGPFPPECRR